MQMVFLCAKGYQSELVDAQSTEKDRIREQRDLNEIKRLEKLILGNSTLTLQEHLIEEGCSTLTIEEIKKLIETSEL